MSPVFRALALSCCLALSLAGGARAQFIRPGSGLEESETRTLITLRGDAESALWHVGPFRVTPRLGLQDVRYDSTARSPTSEDEGDVTATVGAGFDAYLPVGSDSVFDFSVLPAYVYWAEFSEQNRLVGTYSAGFVSHFNRLELSLEALHREDIEFATPELLQRLPQEQREFEASLEVALSRNVALRVAGQQRTVRLDEPEANFEPGLATLRRLDRDETRVRAGIVLGSRDRVRVEAGLQREVNEFETADRANEGDSPYLALRLQGNRLELDADVAQRSLEPRDGAAFEPVDSTTGRFRLTLSPGWRISYTAYGERRIGYSLDEAQSHLEDTRLGLGLGIELSNRSRLRLWAEDGDLRYASLSGLSRPDEEIAAYGGNLTVDLSERSRLRLGGGHFEIDSPLPEAAREWDFVTAGVTVTFSRVRIDVGTGI